MSAPRPPSLPTTTCLRLTAAALTLFACSEPPAPPAYDWKLPEGFPEPRVPKDNPMTEAKVALGRYLFFDKRLSGNQTQSCGSCHAQRLAFSDGLARAVGSTGQMHPRGSMALVNVAYNSTLAWVNPALLTLEQQLPLPLFGEHPVELGATGKEDEILMRLRTDARYVELFRDAFPGQASPFSFPNVIQALASFTRSLISGNSPFDRYAFRQDRSALGASALAGMRLFFSERLECFHCHGGFNFSASTTHEGSVFEEIAFHNNGLYNVGGTGAYPPDNPGLFQFTGDRRDLGKFRAPTLRNIAVTAPYMHDGSLATLEEVLDFYAAGGRNIESGPLAGDGRAHPSKSRFITGFTLTPDERQAVLDFLHSLTDPEFLRDPRHADPFAPSASTN